MLITGGQFDALNADTLVSMTGYRRNPEDLFTQTLDIRGGQWGYEAAGHGLSFSQWVDFSISGWDLTFVDGLLSGYLLDGNGFSNQVTFASDWQGAFTINNVTAPSVPEPGTLGLLMTCVAGMMFARRRPVA